MKVLITGIAGKLGRRVARELADVGHEVLGMDRRPWPDAPEGVEMFNADIRKRPAEDVFRTRCPHAVLHMATVSHQAMRTEERYQINLNGTRSVFTYCERYGIERVVFIGRHTYYGASADAPLYHTEEAPPHAVTTYPELADMVAADLYAGSALWRYPRIMTSVLRVCYTLGPLRHGTLADYLQGPRVPTVLGFDPLFQFMHEHDVARAIVAALGTELRGVFNVCGPQPIPLSLLIRLSGRTNVPMPEALFKRAVGRFGLPKLSTAATNHIKFPIVIDGNLFKQSTGFEHAYDEIRTIEAFRWAS
ncbi:MAG: NAD-dependent epimerase/dehydratase family protein [Myxococcota bacterium]